ncbi:NAD(P)/FAD-dependent oxidoreductase [Robiginitalea sp. SC105]|uniref:NAD(P)/FAD-dependent oxidoreductase n=1 Tax=Robiginitalea sp. SC105 TaxID=2762332 RepID=UPI00163B1EDF|nr:NAD(P)/FAD-dependent oxidoreductase [Robiginitalea sp. SC105]MBC2838319.1 FAD-dependent oxidoreductase [Robiginitalea sp. SC105]
MEKDAASPQIYIIGAGISGLVAARKLEEEGYRPVILEATDRPGGRVKTDRHRGALLDHGFQVLLTAYPQARKKLDYAGLKLHRFKPGALIFQRGRSQRIGDPLRDPGSLWPTLIASVGTVGDKWKIFALSNRLKRKSLAEIFAAESETTGDYLRGLGFSRRIIDHFFRPFFTGIFLETELRTSSRMFEFTFKMFSEGYAALPEAGIGAIPEQLAGALAKTEIRYRQAVDAVGEKEITLATGETLPADGVVCTTPLDTTSGKVQPGAIRWKRCDNLYFTTDSRRFPEGLIGLVADGGALVNNLYYPFGQSVDGDPLLSVTVVRPHELETEDLVQQVREELRRLCGIEAKAFIRRYAIERALPDLEEVRLEWGASRGPGQAGAPSVVLAGDFQVNGSLNAAMASGEAAAAALIRRLQAPS